MRRMSSGSIGLSLTVAHREPRSLSAGSLPVLLCCDHLTGSHFVVATSVRGLIVGVNTSGRRLCLGPRAARKSSVLNTTYSAGGPGRSRTCTAFAAVLQTVGLATCPLPTHAETQPLPLLASTYPNQYPRGQRTAVDPAPPSDRRISTVSAARD